MLKRTIIVLGVLVLVVALVPTAFAANFGLGRQARDGSCGDGVCAAPDLDLTPEQAERLAEVRAAFRAEVDAMREQRAAIMAQVRELRRDPEADQAQLEARLQELNQLREAFQEKAAGYREALTGILTPEQIEKLGDRQQGCGPLGSPDGGRGEGKAHRGQGGGGRGCRFGGGG